MNIADCSSPVPQLYIKGELCSFDANGFDTKELL